jgi:hypothetical protein
MNPFEASGELHVDSTLRRHIWPFGYGPTTREGPLVGLNPCFPSCTTAETHQNHRNACIINKAKLEAANILFMLLERHGPPVYPENRVVNRK